MKFKTSVAIATAISVVLVPVAASAKINALAKTMGIVANMPYKKARAILISHGFNPVLDEQCTNICIDPFREVQCAVDKPLCTSYFKKGAVTLHVVGAYDEISDNPDKDLDTETVEHSH